MENTFIEIVTQESRHKTAAIPGTTTSVPNYPSKLKVYLNNASPYCYDKASATCNGKYDVITREDNNRGTKRELTFQCKK